MCILYFFASSEHGANVMAPLAAVWCEAIGRTAPLVGCTETILAKMIYCCNSVLAPVSWIFRCANATTQVKFRNHGLIFQIVFPPISDPNLDKINLILNATLCLDLDLRYPLTFNLIINCVACLGRMSNLVRILIWLWKWI